MKRLSIFFIALLGLTGCDDDRHVPSAREPALKAERPVVLQDSDGFPCPPLAGDGRTATVLIFLMQDCPVANASAPEMARIAKEFSQKGIRFYGIYATETAAEINAHRRDYSLPFPGLLDPKCELARLAGATRVPEAAIFSPAGALLYRGRIDDRAVKPGTTKPVPHQHDLRLALEAVLAGKQPEPKFTTAIGCHLPLD